MILGVQSVCGQLKFPKYVCLVNRIGEQLPEEQILKIILDIICNTARAILFNNTVNRPKGWNFVKNETLADVFLRVLQNF